MMNACARWSILAVPVLAALGCSDPVPLPAQGAISLSVQKPITSVNGSTCPESGHVYDVSDGNRPPSESTPGESVIDGEGGAKVSCSVRKSGTSYVFSGSFSGTTSSAPIYPITVSFRDGVINADKVTGTANVSVYTPVLAASFGSTAPCTFHVIGGNVKGGSIWASFTCGSLANPPAQVCSVGSSVIVFENCDGS